MDFKNATKFKKDFQFIIGKTYDGIKIENLVISPKNEEQLFEFAKILLRTNNPDFAIKPFLNSDLTVSVLLDKRIEKDGLFMPFELSDVLQKLDIDYDINNYL